MHKPFKVKNRNNKEFYTLFPLGTTDIWRFYIELSNGESNNKVVHVAVLFPIIHKFKH